MRLLESFKLAVNKGYNIIELQSNNKNIVESLNGMKNNTGAAKGL